MTKQRTIFLSIKRVFSLFVFSSMFKPKLNEIIKPKAIRFSCLLMVRVTMHQPFPMNTNTTKKKNLKINSAPIFKTLNPTNGIPNNKIMIKFMTKKNWFVFKFTCSRLN